MNRVPSPVVDCFPEQPGMTGIVLLSDAGVAVVAR